MKEDHEDSLIKKRVGLGEGWCGGGGGLVLVRGRPCGDV